MELILIARALYDSTIIMMMWVKHMAPRSRWLFGRILTTLVAVVLILYTVLDEIYVHIWFNTENAMLVPLTWIPISACSVAILEWMRRAEKKERTDQQGSKKRARCYW